MDTMHLALLNRQGDIINRALQFVNKISSMPEADEDNEYESKCDGKLKQIIIEARDIQKYLSPVEEIII